MAKHCRKQTTALDVMRLLIQSILFFIQSSAPISADNTFQDLPLLRETVDNTERYI
jgi:hypothetical protein